MARTPQWYVPRGLRAGGHIVELGGRRRKEFSRKLRLPPQLTTPESFVFANAIGGAMDPGNWYRREWTPTLEKVGLVDVVEGRSRRPRFHFHELRHYAATRLDELGMSAKLRTEIVGHANEEITNSVYTHVSRERVAAAAKCPTSRFTLGTSSATSCGVAASTSRRSPCG